MSNELNPKTDPGQPMVYQIRLQGHLGRQWTEWFGDVTITLEDNGETLLTCRVVDQAALYGLLRKVRDLGLPLISVTRVKPGQAGQMSNRKSRQGSQKEGLPSTALLAHPGPRVRKVNTVLLKSNWMKFVDTVRERRITMSTNKRTAGLDMKALLSTLWMFVLFNIAFRDLHEILRPGFLEEVMTGTVNGVQMTEGFLLLGGIMLEIPIAMVLLSRVLPYRANRWANIIAGPIAIALVVFGGPSDLDDMFFATIEVVTLLLIVWYAWKWPNPGLSPNNGIQ